MAQVKKKVIRVSRKMEQIWQESSLYYSCNFSVCLILFQNKSLKKQMYTNILTGKESIGKSIVALARWAESWNKLDTLTWQTPVEPLKQHMWLTTQWGPRSCMNRGRTESREKTRALDSIRLCHLLGDLGQTVIPQSFSFLAYKMKTYKMKRI